jgi:hypothetical protein
MMRPGSGMRVIEYGAQLDKKLELLGVEFAKPMEEHLQEVYKRNKEVQYVDEDDSRHYQLNMYRDYQPFFGLDVAYRELVSFFLTCQ